MKKRFYGIYYPALLSIAVTWIASCDYGTTEPAPPTNQPPVAEGPLPWDRLTTGDMSRTDVSTYFRDPEGEVLDYMARSRDPGVVRARTEGSTLTLAAVAQGVAEVTVSARDAGGRSASLTVVVTVAPGTPGGAASAASTASAARAGSPAEEGFQIAIVPVDEGAEQYLPVLEEAAHQWEAILRDTELPDLTFAHEAPFVCHGLSTGTAVAGVDDLMVLASIGRIDGYGGARGGASVCLVREGSLLPVAGTIRLDQEDLFAMSDNDVKDVMLHDLGHTLGIGMIWSARDLLRSPATSPASPDAHFTGAEAIAAFNAAGGTGYTGPRVPVEHLGGPLISLHWRESVFGTELMSPVQNARIRDPLSEVTIQSLNDLGYTADASLAEPSRLPGAAGAGMAAQSDPGRTIDLSEDVDTGPIQIVGSDGRVVGAIDN